MKKTGILIQIIGLIIMVTGIWLQVSKGEVGYLFVTFSGLFAVMAGLFVITLARKKGK